MATDQKTPSQTAEVEVPPAPDGPSRSAVASRSREAWKTIVRQTYRDPVLFVRKVLKAEPDPWQIEALQTRKRVVVAGCHGGGTRSPPGRGRPGPDEMACRVLTTGEYLDCAPRTRFGLHNAFTRAIKALPPAPAFEATSASGRCSA